MVSMISSSAANGPPTKKWSKITVIIAAAMIGGVVYIVAPIFLPVYRWTQVDWHQIAAKHQVSASDLKQEYEVTLRYNPRRLPYHLEDPVPWQLLTIEPEHPENPEIEEWVQQRVVLISDQTGAPPSRIRLSSVDRERFFTATVNVLPEHSLGYTVDRPVLLYRGMSLDKLSIGEGITWLGRLDNEHWPNDDEDVWDLYDAGLVDEYGKPIGGEHPSE